MSMKRFIAVTPDTRQAITKVFGMTSRTIDRALSYAQIAGNSPQARRIRVMALERGGIPMITAPEVETFHDADGFMRQYFLNGVMLEANKKTGDVRLIKNSVVIAEYKDIKLTELDEIQKRAAGL